LEGSRMNAKVGKVKNMGQRKKKKRQNKRKPAQGGRKTIGPPQVAEKE